MNFKENTLDKSYFGREYKYIDNTILISIYLIPMNLTDSVCA